MLDFPSSSSDWSSPQWFPPSLQELAEEQKNTPAAAQDEEIDLDDLEDVSDSAWHVILWLALSSPLGALLPQLHQFIETPLQDPELEQLHKERLRAMMVGVILGCSLAKGRSTEHVPGRVACSVLGFTQVQTRAI